MRCFIAIDLPQEIKKELEKTEREIQKIADEAGAKLKIVKPENLHITLKFLGELPEEKVNKIKEVMKKVFEEEIKLKPPKPFKVKLNSIGTFPSLDYIKAVWVDVLPKEQIIEIEKKIDRTLEGIGFKENKNFEIHITLTRVKFIKNKKRFLEGLKKITIEPIEFEIRNFSLKKSTLTKEGPIYEDIFKFDFL